MNANNITQSTKNTNDYNTFEITYLSNGINTITPITVEQYYSDIWNNFLFIN